MADQRLKVTVPDAIDAVLQGLVEVTGRTKSSFIVESMTWSLPHWKKLLRQVERGIQGPVSVGPRKGQPVDEFEEPDAVDQVRRSVPKVGRNDPCPCGSGKKYKACCGG